MLYGKVRGRIGEILRDLCWQKRLQMVGYEMLGNPQRDINPETSAERLRALSDDHYKVDSSLMS